MKMKDNKFNTNFSVGEIKSLLGPKSNIPSIQNRDKRNQAFLREAKPYVRLYVKSSLPRELNLCMTYFIKGWAADIAEECRELLTDHYYYDDDDDDDSYDMQPNKRILDVAENILSVKSQIPAIVGGTLFRPDRIDINYVENVRQTGDIRTEDAKRLYKLITNFTFDYYKLNLDALEINDEEYDAIDACGGQSGAINLWISQKSSESKLGWGILVQQPYEYNEKYYAAAANDNLAAFTLNMEERLGEDAADANYFMQGYDRDLQTKIWAAAHVLHTMPHYLHNMNMPDENIQNFTESFINSCMATHAGGAGEKLSADFLRRTMWETFRAVRGMFPRYKYLSDNLFNLAALYYKYTENKFENSKVSGLITRIIEKEVKKHALINKIAYCLESGNLKSL